MVWNISTALLMPISRSYRCCSVRCFLAMMRTPLSSCVVVRARECLRTRVARFALKTVRRGNKSLLGEALHHPFYFFAHRSVGLVGGLHYRLKAPVVDLATLTQ